MARFILLDTGPLGLAVKNPKKPDTARFLAWMEAVIGRGSRIVIPEIADYELRRELIRINSGESLKRLDDLGAACLYLPITTDDMVDAAFFWADVRNRGGPTADDKALDGDCILAAQSRFWTDPEDEVLIATTNPGHLMRFLSVVARPWDEIA